MCAPVRTFHLTPRTKADATLVDLDLSSDSKNESGCDMAQIVGGSGMKTRLSFDSKSESGCDGSDGRVLFGYKDLSLTPRPKAAATS